MGLLVDIANDLIENLTPMKTFSEYSDNVPDISSFLPPARMQGCFLNTERNRK